MLLLALVAGLPAVIVALVLICGPATSPTPKVQWTLTLLILGFWWASARRDTRARGVAAADAGESAGGDARRRLFDSRPRSAPRKSKTLWPM